MYVLKVSVSNVSLGLEYLLGSFFCAFFKAISSAVNCCSALIKPSDILPKGDLALESGVIPDDAFIIYKPLKKFLFLSLIII